MIYKRACNLLLTGLVERMCFLTSTNPVLVVRNGKVVVESDGSTWKCDCGCTTRKEGWRIHERN